MSESEPTDRERGLAMLQEFYAGDVADIPEGTMPFFDVMLESLFAKVWPRDVLSIRDRRLLIMGVIAAQGKTDVWGLQAKAALTLGELTPDELRETLITLAPYAGYPHTASLTPACEAAIAAHEADADADGSAEA